MRATALISAAAGAAIGAAHAVALGRDARCVRLEAGRVGIDSIGMIARCGGRPHTRCGHVIRHATRIDANVQ